MAQAGMHALVGTAIRKIAPKREWLMLGIILGSLFPDLDNYAVAIATIAKLPTTGLHRTFTHSLFTMIAAFVVFFIVATLLKQPRWMNIGLGLGIGIGLHILLDLVLWFNGVQLLWPLSPWINFWEGIKPPLWFSKLMDPAEFLFFGLFFLWLAKAARDHKTDVRKIGALRIWIIAMAVLWVVFTALVFIMSKGFLTVYGLIYLVIATAAFIITIQMRQTVEAY